ncbi:MAG TPA: SDR family NAD(P)-dependent oxidoreductase [Opitutaceae bacterium]|jgi:gluconate 5-dehydrogenase|nr:SDR family NAD(P)-dependent oxidoreductase [Opitutaceae bacterium]
MAEKNPLFDLTGRTALITGSSQGLGLALARGLGQAGAALVLNGRNKEKLAATAAQLRGEGLRVMTAVFDVTDDPAVEREVARIEAEVAPIDILVNNAGIQRRAPLEQVEVAVWREVLDTNLTSAFLVARQVARRMIPRRAGKIINICSLMSELGRATTGPYTAAKGGLKMLTRAMAVEWAKHNLQVNGIGPGYFMTELTKPLVENPEFNQWVCQRTPAARWGQPHELVGAAVFLASPAADFVNGQIIYVDGGLLAAI